MEQNETAVLLGIDWLYAWDDLLNMQLLCLCVITREQSRQAYAEIVALYNARPIPRPPDALAAAAAVRGAA